MLWLVYALMTVFTRSLVDVFGKKSLAHVDEYIAAWAWRFLALPFLIPLLFIIDIPALSWKAVVLILLSGGLTSLTAILYMRALKLSDLSLCVPLTAFTPIFVLMLTPFLIGEIPSAIGLVGVFLIVLGSYLLNINAFSEGVLEPLKSLLRDKGARIMLLVAFIWAVINTIDKAALNEMGLTSHSAMFFATATYLVMGIILTPVMLLSSNKPVQQFRKSAKYLFFIGATASFYQVMYLLAMSLALVVYVSAIMRLTTLITVLFGHLLFKEKGIKERMAATCVMVLGVVLIALL